MKYILTADQMMDCDSYTIEHFHVPSIVLMERAAQRCIDEIYRAEYDLSHVLVVCGSGNNGGDGFAIARILHERGVNVEIMFTGIITHMSPETRENHDSCASYKIPIKSSIKDVDYSLIIDAMFGIGLNRELEARTVSIINEINSYRNNGAAIVAIDIPSGVNAQSGEVMGAAIRADMTITFAYYKQGLLLYPGAEYTGNIVLADIGITSESLERITPFITCIDEDDLRKSPIVNRPDNSNKGTFGKVLIIAGNENMSGCAVLAATACFKAGAGMVRVYTHKENKQYIIDKLPEAMVDTYEDEIDTDKLASALKWADVIGIGPGLGKGKRAKDIFEYVFFKSNKPVIIDADGIALLKQYHLTLKKGVSKEIVITPHIGELSNFIDKDKQDIKKHIIEYALETAKTYNVTCVAKDSRSVIASIDGNCKINVSGNNGMASAGMGDCLVGIICAFKARGLSSYDAATYGCFVHGLAGDRIAKKTGKAGLIASDLIEGLSLCLEDSDE